VFTLPQQIAAVAYQNKRELYGILFKATAETLLAIAADPKRLGAEIGFFAVLHTWDLTCFIILIYTVSFPAVGSLRIAPSGFPARLDSFCPSGCSQGCFVACFWNICSKPLMPAN
jgi:hypothetical protein